MTERRVLIYGDSNSFGTAPMQSLMDDGVIPRGARWGDVLARGLGDGWEVLIEGLPGRTTVFDDPIEGAYRNGLTVLPAILHSHKPIDHLLICLGANDQKHRFQLRAEDVALGVARLVREARLSDTVGKVLVICPPPVKLSGPLAEMFDGIDDRSAGLSDMMEVHARAEGAAFFDAGSVIEVDPIDGVHWSEAAHRRLGAALVEVVRTLE